MLKTGHKEISVAKCGGAEATYFCYVHKIYLDPPMRILDTDGRIYEGCELCIAEESEEVGEAELYEAGSV